MSKVIRLLAAIPNAMKLGGDVPPFRANPVRQASGHQFQ
jgi:hypothetical protein